MNKNEIQKIKSEINENKKIDNYFGRQLVINQTRFNLLELSNINENPIYIGKYKLSNNDFEFKIADGLLFTILKDMDYDDFTVKVMYVKDYEDELKDWENYDNAEKNILSFKSQAEINKNFAPQKNGLHELVLTYMYLQNYTEYQFDLDDEIYNDLVIEAKRVISIFNEKHDPGEFTYEPVSEKILKKYKEKFDNLKIKERLSNITDGD